MANDRVIGQTKGAGFQVGVRRSFSISSEDAWNLLTSPDGLNLWLGESTGIILNPGQTYMTNLGSGEIRIVKPLQQLRLTWKKEGWEQPSTVQIRVLSKADNQLCLGIIASRIGFVLAQRTPFRFRDIRQRLYLHSVGVWTPTEKETKPHSSHHL